MRVSGLLFAAATWAISGCDDEPAEVAAPASASVAGPRAAPSSVPKSEACRLASREGGFTIGPPVAEMGDGDEAPLALPNAVELGGAAQFPTGFAAAVLAESGGETHAELALVGEGVDAGRVVDLGRVHGLVPPPRVAAVGGGVLVAVVDGDVSGTLLRMARVEGDTTGARVAWGSTIPQGNDESPVFGLAASGERAVVVWDAWNDEDDHGEIQSVSLSASGALDTETPNVLSASSHDAEDPRIAPRPGGFWAAWIESAPLTKQQRRHVDEDTAPGVAMSPRWLVVARLDEAGRGTAPPVRATAKEGSVLGFDLLSVDGGALVVWRDDTTSPATPGGRILSAKVGDDGAVTSGVVATEDVGAGDPLLLAPASDKHSAWLAFAAEDDTPRLARVARDGSIGAPVGEKHLTRGMPLLATPDGLLVATPIGRSIELSRLTCDSATGKGKKGATR